MEALLSSGTQVYILDSLLASILTCPPAPAPNASSATTNLHEGKGPAASQRHLGISKSSSSSVCWQQCGCIIFPSTMDADKLGAIIGGSACPALLMYPARCCWSCHERLHTGHCCLGLGRFRWLVLWYLERFSWHIRKVGLATSSLLFITPKC